MMLRSSSTEIPSQDKIGLAIGPFNVQPFKMILELGIEKPRVCL